MIKEVEEVQENEEGILKDHQLLHPKKLYFSLCSPVDTYNSSTKSKPSPENLLLHLNVLCCPTHNHRNFPSVSIAKGSYSVECWHNLGSRDLHFSPYHFYTDQITNWGFTHKVCPDL